MIVQRPRHARRVSLAICITALASQVGCTSLPSTDFTHCLRDPQGQCILLDDIQLILNDTSKNTDEKRDALRNLGIEDEKLIDALLSS